MIIIIIIKNERIIITIILIIIIKVMMIKMMITIITRIMPSPSSRPLEGWMSSHDSKKFHERAVLHCKRHNNSRQTIYSKSHWKL